jgi:hypothetical protein
VRHATVGDYGSRSRSSAVRPARSGYPVAEPVDDDDGSVVGDVGGGAEPGQDLGGLLAGRCVEADAVAAGEEGELRGLLSGG